MIPKGRDLPGLFATIIVAAIAYGLSPSIPFLGRNMLALLLGLLVANVGFELAPLRSGVKFTEKTVLAIAIALLGTSLSPQALAAGGGPVVLFVISVVVTAITLAIILGRLLKLPPSLCVLVGIGNAICGVSAIVASASVLRSSDRDKAISIGVINIWGTAGMFVLPALLARFGASDSVSATVLGGSLQAVGQVVAAGYTIGEAVGEQAVLVKMCRILMLVPLLMVLSFRAKGDTPHSPAGSSLSRFAPPPYLIGFIGFAVLAGFFPNAPVTEFLRLAARWFLLVAMAGLGMNLRLRDMRVGAASAIFAGGLGFAIQIAVAVGLSLILF